MSHLFQRPLCEMGRAYDYAFRPIVGAPDEGDGGGCDDRPEAVALFAASDERASREARPRSFELCPEHATQLRKYDERIAARGIPPRFAAPLPRRGG